MDMVDNNQRIIDLMRELKDNTETLSEWSNPDIFLD